MSKVSFLVVDDFLPNPWAAREAALGDKYTNLNETGKYSPFRATSSMVRRISDLLGTKLAPAGGLGTGRYNYRLARERHVCDIHVDSCAWGGVLFLNPPQQCRGGTSFWRHKKTGLERWPNRVEQAELLARYRITNCWEFFVTREGMRRERWERCLEVPMRFNRLVLFRGEFFHSHSHYFGTRRDNARLTQLFFFDEAIPESSGSAPHLGNARARS